MAERGLEGPLFYHGYFGYPSVTTEMLAPDQRSEFRATYKRLYRSFGYKSFKSKMQARGILRTLLYDTLEMKGRL